MFHKILFISLLGNIIEYFSFSIFGIFASSIGQEFFPEQSSYKQLIFTLLIFGTGFIGRPLGAIFFGHFGDKIGRKLTLSYTILGMALSTLAIGLTPGFNVMGYISIIMLVIFRLLQGFFVGGEGPGSALYVLEHTKEEHKGIVGGAIISSIVFGAFLASLVGALFYKFNINDSLVWRMPFFIASLFGFIGIYLRFSLPETQAFLNNKKKHKRLPIFESFFTHGNEMVILIFLGGITTSVAYTVMIYFKSFFEIELGMSHIRSILYSLYAMLLYMVSLLFMGKFSVYVGYRKFTLLFALIIALFAIPIFEFLGSENDVMFFVAFFSFPILSAGICAPAYPYAIDKFSVYVRCSGVGVSYTLGIALFGGFSPAIYSYLLHALNFRSAPAIYIVVLALLYIIVDLKLHRKY